MELYKIRISLTSFGFYGTLVRYYQKRMIGGGLLELKSLCPSLNTIPYFHTDTINSIVTFSVCQYVCCISTANTWHGDTLLYLLSLTL